VLLGERAFCVVRRARLILKRESLNYSMAEPGVIPGVAAGAIAIAPFSVRRELVTELAPSQTAVIVSPLGSAATLVQRYPAVAASDSEIRWQVVSPSSTVGLDRHFYVAVQFDITYTPDGAAGVVLPKNVPVESACGPRQFPIHSVTSNIRMELNNASLSMNSVNQVIHGLNAYAFGESTEETALWAGMASKKDVVASAYSGANAGDTAYPFATLSASEASDTRALYYYTVGPVDQAPGAPVGTQRVRVRLVERIQGPLCLFGEKSGPALFNVDNFNLSLSFSTLRRLLSGVQTGWIGAVGAGGVTPFQDATPLPANPTAAELDAIASRFTVSVVNTPDSHSLWCKFLQPPPGITIMPQLIWKWSDVQTFSTTFQFPAVAVGTSTQAAVTCQLSGVPSRAYVFCAPDFSNSPGVQMFRPSHFSRLSNLSVTFDNRSGLLSALDDPYLLYAGSRENGLTLSWLKAQYGLGMVHCFTFGGSSGNTIDLPQPSVAAGCNGTYTLRVQATAEKLEAAVTAYRMYILTLHDGLVTCTGQQFTPSVNPLSEAMILEATAPGKYSVAAPGTDVQRRAGWYGATSEMVGGSFLSFLGDAWKGIRSIGGPIARAVGSIAPALSFIPGVGVAAPIVGSVASGVASALGSGKLTAAQKRRLLRGKGGVETADTLSARAKLLS
jgi:hypothetical protein